MAFRELTPGKAVGGGAGPRVTVALALRAKGTRAVLSIGLNHLALTHAGLAIGDRVRVLLGEGDMAGKLRIEAHKDGAFDLKGLAGPHKSATPGCVLRIVDPAFVLDVRDKRRAEWERLADPAARLAKGDPAPILGVTIDLPKSFFPQPVMTVAAATPASAPVAQKQIGASRDATASVMGDPPRGRSALGAR